MQILCGPGHQARQPVTDVEDWRLSWWAQNNGKVMRKGKGGWENVKTVLANKTWWMWEEDLK
jgi:hypothetical protein